MAVKFGGSVISDRAGFCAFREDGMRAFVRTLADHARAAPGLPPLVLLGGGSFAHPFAERVVGTADPAERAAQAACMADALDGLRDRFVAECRDAGLAAAAWSEQALFGIGEAGPVARAEEVAALAASGGIAVLTGGCLDRGGGDYALLSSDDLVLLLCDRIPISDFAIFTDVEGVMDWGRGGLVEHVADGGAEALLGYCGENKAGDMTGGMRRKIANCSELIRRGIACYIGSGRAIEPGALSAIAAGTRRGTYFHVAAPPVAATQPGEKN